MWHVNKNLRDGQLGTATPGLTALCILQRVRSEPPLLIYWQLLTPRFCRGPGCFLLCPPHCRTQPSLSTRVQLIGADAGLILQHSAPRLRHQRNGSAALMSETALHSNFRAIIARENTPTRTRGIL